MQQEELPKAQRFFKQIVDKRVENYISKAQQVADSFMKQKIQAQQNISISSHQLRELKRQVQILKTVQLTKVEVPGTTIQDVRELIGKYQRMIQNFNEKIKTENEQEIQYGYDENLNQNLDQEMSNKIIDMDSQSNLESELFISSSHMNLASKNKEIAEKIQSSTTRRKNIIKRSLKSLQFMILTVMISCVTKFMFFV